MKKLAKLVLTLLILPIIGVFGREEPMTLLSHELGVFSLSWSPNSKYLATASLDGSVSLWRPEGVLVRKIKAHDNKVLGVAFSPDGGLIATASADKTIGLFTLKGELEQGFPGHTADVLALAWSPDGQTLVSGSDDMTLRIFHRSGSLITNLGGQMQALVALDFSSDGKHLLIAERGIHLMLRDTKTWAQLKLIPAHRDVIWAATYSPLSGLIASVSKDHTARIWTHEGEPLKSFNLPDEAWSVAFSPDERHLACGLRNGDVLVYDLETQDLVQTLKGHRGGVLKVSWAPNGKYLASASQDKTVKLWKNIRPN